MPRRYYRRRTVAVRPKKKWASNIVVWDHSTINVGNLVVPLVVNKTQADAPTPTIIKTGNFKITADVNFALKSSVTGFSPACIAYIVYAPEGWNIESFGDLITKHPEWIICTKMMGGNITATSATGFGVETLNMSSRLKRNLNSGDQVALYLKLNFAASGVDSVTITGNCRYWTCAN